MVKNYFFQSEWLNKQVSKVHNSSSISVTDTVMHHACGSCLATTIFFPWQSDIFQSMIAELACRKVIKQSLIFYQTFWWKCVEPMFANIYVSWYKQQKGQQWWFVSFYVIAAICRIEIIACSTNGVTGKYNITSDISLNLAVVVHVEL